MRFGLMLAVLSSGAIGCGDNISTLQCEAGETLECVCSDGSSASQQCLDGNRLTPCACESDTPVDAGTDSNLDSDGGSVIGNCDDGTFDQGDVCATEPYAGGVYFEGTLSEGSCSAMVLQQFWPTLSANEIRPFPCTPSYYRFRSDDSLVYLQNSGELQLYEDGSGDPLISTPGCEGNVRSAVGFDENDRPFYLCGLDLFAGANLIRAELGMNYAGTLADGRSLIVEPGAHPGRLDYVVIDDAGNELSRLAPHAEIDKLRPLTDATTIDGDVAYVLFERIDATSLEAPERELISYRLDADNEFQPSRRTTIDTFERVLFTSNRLVLSDGSMFLRESDPDSDAQLDERIRGFLPDGSVRVLWREAESPRVKSSAFTRQILQGPLEAPLN